MKPIAKLNSYINSAIPYAWDDSESWFEFLGKVLAKVNELVEASNDYFAVDLVTYTENLLAEWVANGRMTTLLNALIAHKANQTEMLEGDAAGIAYTDAKNTILQEMLTQQYTTMLTQQYAVLNAKIDDVVSGSPAGTYTDLAALIAADPDHSNIYVVTEDGKWYYWDGNAWVPGGVYQATQITNASITGDKLDLASIGQEKLSVRAFTSVNKFDMTRATAGVYVAFQSGNLEPSESFYASDYISIIPGNTYVKTDNSQLAFYDKSKSYLSGLSSAGVFTAPEHAVYVRLTIPSYRLSQYILSEGTQLPPYTPFAMRLIPSYLEDKSIGPEKLSRNYVEPVVGKNLFNKNDTTEGVYVSYLDGTLNTASGFHASGFIMIEPLTDYVKSDSAQLAFFDAQKNYISGIDVVSNNTFRSPAESKFVRLTVSESNIDSYQLEKGLTSTTYEPFGYFIDSSMLQDMPDRLESGMQIQIPEQIYLLKGEEFSIYWRNVLKYSNKLKSGDYYVRAQKVNSGVYSEIGEDYGYKWTYTPQEAETFDLEVRVYNLYRGTVVVSKTISFIVAEKNPTQVKSGRIVTVGDSFVDGHQVSRFMHVMVEESSNIALDMIGLHSTGVAGVMDDAWSGYGYNFFWNNEAGYLRSDRPLSDAIWDAGWGKDEVNGWTDGQTFDDLTPTQKSHGRTRNQFYNPATYRFDFGFYMANNHPTIVPSNQSGDHLDGFLSFLGLNDFWWKPITQVQAELPSFKIMIDHVIDSVHSWDPNIVVMLALITPQGDQDAFMNSYQSNFLHSYRAKHTQELWNELILTNYDSIEMRQNNIFVVPTSSHFDTRTGIRTKTINPNKFDSSYSETVIADIHPNETGAKYIADVSRNFIIHKVVK